jgi:hypothetical protein
MRKLAALVSIVVAVVFSAGLVVSAQVPDKMVLKEIQKSQPPVPFDHKAHVARAKDCRECHHADAAGAEQKCSACHKEKAEGKTVALKEAFHITCRDCHKKDASKKAPTSCSGCHPK